MGMIQLVEKKASRPRSELACCWVSAAKALLWSMSCQPPRVVISMGTGVEGGSMLVPELPCCWTASARVWACMTIWAAQKCANTNPAAAMARSFMVFL
jgi:hypothetical protein